MATETPPTATPARTNTSASRHSEKIKPDSVRLTRAGFGLLDILIAGSLLVMALSFTLIAVRNSSDSQLKTSYSATLESALRYLEDDLSSSQTRFASAQENTPREIVGVEMLEYFQAQGVSLTNPANFSATVKWRSSAANTLGYQGLAKFDIKACLITDCKQRSFEASIPVFIVASNVASGKNLTVDVSGPAGVTPDVKVLSSEPRTYTLSTLGRTRYSFSNSTDVAVNAQNVTAAGGLSATATVTKLSSTSFRVNYALKEGRVTLTSSGGVSFNPATTGTLTAQRFVGPGVFVLREGNYTVSPDPVAGSDVAADPASISLRGGEQITIATSQSVRKGTVSVEVSGAGARSPEIRFLGAGGVFTQIGTGVITLEPGRYSVQAQTLQQDKEDLIPNVKPDYLTVNAGTQAQVSVEYPQGEVSNPSGPAQGYGIVKLIILNKGVSVGATLTNMLMQNGKTIPLTNGDNVVPEGYYIVKTQRGTALQQNIRVSNYAPTTVYVFYSSQLR